MSSLASALDIFSKRVNGHDRLHKLIRTWNRTLLIESLDAPEKHVLVVDGGKVALLGADALGGEPDVFVQGDAAVLVDVFSGTRNPAAAVLDGEMVVLGSDTDQLKLDAIAFVLWGES